MNQEFSIESLGEDDTPMLSEDDCKVLIALIKNDRVAQAIPSKDGYRQALLNVIAGFELQENV